MRFTLPFIALLASIAGGAIYDHQTRVCAPVIDSSFSGKVGVWERCKGGLTGGTVGKDKLIYWID